MSRTALDQRFLAPDFEESPYWWRSAPPFESSTGALPDQCDIAIVGGGFGGVAAALVLARSGHSVAIFDASALGSGACSRNMGGLVERVEGLERQKGAEPFGVPLRAFEAEGVAAARFTLDLARAEGIECSLRQDGRLVFASTAKALEVMAARLAARSASDPSCGDRIIGRDGIAAEAGGLFSTRYFGALVSPAQKTLHPGRLVNGLIEAARRAGASLQPNTPVTGFQRRPDNGFDVQTTRGVVRARSLVVTTAGYSGTAVPEMRRRVFPFGAHVIATEPLGEDLLRQVTPRRRMFSDTRQNWMVLLPAPDESRLLLAGAYLRKPDPRGAAAGLRSELVALLPELASVRVSNAWFGYMPLSRQFLPQIACIDGVHYCTATGWSMAAYLGNKVALRILGRNGGESVFDRVSFTPFPAPFQPPERARPMLRAAFALLDRFGVAAPR